MQCIFFSLFGHVHCNQTHEKLQFLRNHVIYTNEAHFISTIFAMFNAFSPIFSLISYLFILSPHLICHDRNTFSLKLFPFTRDEAVELKLTGLS